MREWGNHLNIKEAQCHLAFLLTWCSFSLGGALSANERCVMEWLTVATFNEIEEAEPLRRRLQEAGFKAEIHDERKIQKSYFLAPALAGIRLRVPKERHPEAQRLVKEWLARGDDLGHAIICPECGSSRIEFPQFSRHFLWGGIAGIFAALGCFEREFFCKDCNYTWPAKVKVEPKTDILGWPEEHPQHSHARSGH